MLLSLRSLAKNLSTVPGRKTLILFTAGFPLTSERISETTATIDMCNRSNVAIYPIDVRGLVSGVPVAALEPGPRLALPFGAGMSFFQRGGAPGGGTGTRPGGGSPSPGGGGGRTPAPVTSGPAPGRGGTATPSPGVGRTVNPNPGLNNMNTIGPASQARNIMIPKMPEKHAGMRIELGEGNGTDEHRFLISHKRTQKHRDGEAGGGSGEGRRMGQDRV